MSNKNDKAIFKLKAQIEAKKKALKSGEKFSPVTNCSLTIDGERTNLNVLTVESARDLLVRLQGRKLAAESLGILEEYSISGFKLTEWIKDVQSKLTFINRKAEEDKLKLMEAKLHTLLSEDTKVGLEIGDLAKDLGIDVETSDKEV